MKKIIISLAALAAVSSAALAERNYDLRDSDTYWGKFANASTMTDTQALAQPEAKQTIYYGTYGSTMDPAEIRRWDEKNGG